MLGGQMYNPMDPHLYKGWEAAQNQFQHINSISEIEKKKRDSLFYKLMGLQVKAFGLNLLFTVIMAAIFAWAIMYL